MPEEYICIKVRKVYGEKTIVLAKKLEMIDLQLKVRRNAAFIYIPLIREPQDDELKALKEHVPDLEILTYAFREKKKRIKTFVELLEDKLSTHLLASLPRAIDLVGDIAIIEIPPELTAYKKLIGETVLKAHKNVRTVLAKAGAVSGTYRTRNFDVIAGEPKTDTIHKEYSCQYYVDLAKAYFSPRLSYEHKRVASLIKEGETIVDLFAGVGPFAVLIAKIHQNVKIYAVDVNPYALAFLKRNIILNRVEDKVHPILGDARHVARDKLYRVADRVIMNLPENAIEFVDAACEALKPKGGTVHYYSFVTASDSLENAKSRFTETVENLGKKVERILFCRLVRETAPYKWQVVLDANIH